MKAKPKHPEPLLSRPLIMGMLASFGALTSFYLLASALPLYTAESGAGTSGAGLATGVMMAGTVAAETLVPRLLAHYGFRTALALGLLLLGLPALAPLLIDGLPVVLGGCLARGLGLGIIVVAGTTLSAELVPQDRRGEGVGLMGVMMSVPSIAGLPLGLWISQSYGYGPVFLTAAAAALLPLLALPGVPASRPPHTRRRGGVLSGLRTGGMRRPTLVFAAVTLAAGVIMTFLPLAASGRALHLVPAAMLVQSVATPAARWWAGRFGDRHGPSSLLLPGVTLTATGTALLAGTSSPLALFAGMLLFGLGFGISQNATLMVMLARVERSEYSRVSAIWNLAYDAGIGAGAIGYGLLAGHTGYPMGFALTAAVVLLTLLPALRDRQAPSPLSAPAAPAPSAAPACAG